METKIFIFVSSNSEEQQMQQIQDKAKESCMVSFRQLHSHLKLLSNNDLKGTRTESGFKLCIATTLCTRDRGSDVIKSRMYLDDEFVVMTRNYFLQYTQLAIPEFRDTLIQHMESVKKSIDERAKHKTEYTSRVNKDNADTEDKGDSAADQGHVDAHAEDADIRPICDEEPMVEVAERRVGGGIIGGLGLSGVSRRRGGEGEGGGEAEGVEMEMWDECMGGEGSIEERMRWGRGGRSGGVGIGGWGGSWGRVMGVRGGKWEGRAWGSGGWGREGRDGGGGRKVGARREGLEEVESRGEGGGDGVVGHVSVEEVKGGWGGGGGVETLGGKKRESGRKGEGDGDGSSGGYEGGIGGGDWDVGEGWSGGGVAVLVVKEGGVREVVGGDGEGMGCRSGTEWVPTGKIFTSSTTKVDSEPQNGSNADITNQYECAQTLDVSAGTSNLSTGTSFNPKKEELRVWLLKRLKFTKPGLQGILTNEQENNESVHTVSLAPPRQMTSDHNSSELRIHDHSNEPSSSKLVPKVVPIAEQDSTS
ncbi:hypothetical protein Tco_0080461 [Tanacetum coccineum]